MALVVKAPATKPDDLSTVSRTHTVEELIATCYPLTFTTHTYCGIRRYTTGTQNKMHNDIFWVPMKGKYKQGKTDFSTLIQLRAYLLTSGL